MGLHGGCMSRSAKPISSYRHLKATDGVGVMVIVAYGLVTGLGLFLSMGDGLRWLAGQLVLAVALLQWFVTMHEAGHGTLFASAKLNTWSGHLASLFSLIPFHSWRIIHHEHHRWTGWQDLDPTTEALVPRELATFEKVIINTCWWLWIPLFSVLYRVNNFWRMGRLVERVPERHLPRVKRNLRSLGALYALGLVAIGPGMCLEIFGLALLLSFMFMDLILFSQHNHIPQKLSRGEKVSPHGFLEQEQFTRSLVFPKWFALGVLLNFDAHELHHMYPSIPGYRLGAIDYQTQNAIGWWDWVWQSKRVPAATLMFKNRRDTGLTL